MIDHIPAGSLPSRAGAPEYFTGTVRLDPITESRPPSELFAARVTFEPGARTAWHTHPLGQLLIVTFGEGWVQREGGPKEVIRAGDLVWFEPGEKHWHGATDKNAMTHVAIAESLDGKHIDWLEHVSDEEYLRKD